MQPTDRDILEAAELLRRYGEALHPVPRPADEVGPAREALRELVARRADLVRLRQAEKTRQSQDLPDQVRRSTERIVALLGAEIETFDRLVAEAVQATPALAERCRRLRTAPGIGPTFAALIASALPELGRLDRREIAALAGLAPWDNDSGRRRGRRCIRGGRPEIRRALSSAGMHASRGKGPLRKVREDLIARGKPIKLAIVACARRLITWLNAMIRDNKDFAPPI